MIESMAASKWVFGRMSWDCLLRIQHIWHGLCESRTRGAGGPEVYLHYIVRISSRLDYRGVRTACVHNIRRHIFWSDFWRYGDLWDDMLDLEKIYVVAEDRAEPVEDPRVEQRTP